MDCVLLKFLTISLTPVPAGLYWMWQFRFREFIRMIVILDGMLLFCACGKN